MTDMTASPAPSSQEAALAAEDEGYYHESALNATWTGSRLAIGGLAFLFGSFAFAYFYLRSLDSEGRWQGSGFVHPSLWMGTTIMLLAVLSAGTHYFVLQRIKAGHKGIWIQGAIVALGLGLAAVALAAPRVLAESPRRRGRFDLPGAITGTAGVTALVYGLISAATTPNGVSHWGDAKVLAALTAAAVLLAAFAVIETRSPQALLPIRLLRDRNRTGAYLSYAGVGIFIFGMFFFLTVFMQAVWGYSALKTGLAYLPFTAALFLGAGAVAQLVPKIGARPLLLAGSAASTGGLYWLSRISEHDTYASAVLGPTLVIGAGAALLFVTLSLVALNRVPEADSGVASSLLNTAQQVGGAIGLALINEVLNERTDLHITRLQDRVTWANTMAVETLNSFTQRMQGMGDAALMAMKQLSQIVHRQAVVMSYGDAFFMLTVFYMCLSLLVVLVKKPNMMAAAGGDAH